MEGTFAKVYKGTVQEGGDGTQEKVIVKTVVGKSNSLYGIILCFVNLRLRRVHKWAWVFCANKNKSEFVGVTLHLLILIAEKKSLGFFLLLFSSLEPIYSKSKELSFSLISYKLLFFVNGDPLFLQILQT